MLLLRSGLLFLLLSSGLGMATHVMASPESGHADKSQDKNVLVSIHPLALLVKTAWPHLVVTSLVPANQSPHDFSLRPSDLRKVANADSVVWLGNEFEPYLNKLMVKKDSQVDLSKSPETPEMHDEHDEHDEHGEHDEHDEHESHANHDPHLWLQPQQIPVLLASVQKELDLSAPVDFLRSYNAWLKQTHKSFENSKENGFVSFHDAFHYWVEYFNLKQLEIVTLNPEKPVGTRHVVEVRNILASGDAHCLFVEPQFQTRLLNKLTQGLSVKQVNIDPMASNYSINSEDFMGFYQELSQQFNRCLSL